MMSRPGCCANIFVHPDAPQYPQVLEIIENAELTCGGSRRDNPLHADRRDWKYDPDGRPGVWIAYRLFIGHGLFRGMTQKVQKSEAQKAAEARQQLIAQIGQEAFDEVPDAPAGSSGPLKGL